MPKILIVDDEWLTRLEIEQMLTDLGYEVAGQAGTGMEAIALTRETKPDLILMDVFLAGEMNGMDAAQGDQGGVGMPPSSSFPGMGSPEYVEAAKETRALWLRDEAL